jgi:di/tricarboxylate transporter
LQNQSKRFNPGLEAIKKGNKLMDPMKVKEILILLTMLYILFLWINKSKVLGLVGPALLA